MHVYGLPPTTDHVALVLCFLSTLKDCNMVVLNSLCHVIEQFMAIGVHFVWLI